MEIGVDFSMKLITTKTRDKINNKTQICLIKTTKYVETFKIQEIALMVINVGFLITDNKARVINNKINNKETRITKQIILNKIKRYAISSEILEIAHMAKDVDFHMTNVI